MIGAMTSSAAEKPSRRERGLALAIIGASVLLHATFFISAGALWRDEATSAAQARLPSWRALWSSLDHDSFPILYPALLRLWSSIPGCAGDRGLRLLGLLTGLALLGSVWFVLVRLGKRIPLLALVLVGLNGLVIVEGDGIRPYGIGLLFLIWTFYFFGAYVIDPRNSRLVAAELAALASVQASYVNLFFVIAIAASAAAVVARSGRWAVWPVSRPVLVSALSLVLYADPLRHAAAWAPLVRGHVGLSRFVPELFASQGMTAAAVIVLWVMALGRTIGGFGRRASVPASPFSEYAVVTAALGGTAIAALLVGLDMPLFPRYVVAPAVLVALAADALVPRRRWAAPLTVALALGTAPLGWRSVEQRRTNVDRLAAELGRQARGEDLVIVSPWFLAPSFSRYYRGPAPWITVPAIEPSSMTRYDRIASAMRARARGLDAWRIETALARGGALWYVSQYVPDGRVPPEAAEPIVPNPEVNGRAYGRFRSFWEHEADRRLRACCTPTIVARSEAGETCGEEALVLSRWRRRSP
jgi:hypothetical protein